MNSRLYIEPLRAEHLIDLAAHIRLFEVYEDIGGTPSFEVFVLDRERALRGPDQAESSER